MKGRMQIRMMIVLVLAASLVSASLTAVLFMHHYNQAQFWLLGSVCQEVAERQPEAGQTVMEVLKQLKDQPERGKGSGMLEAWGYRQQDFSAFPGKYGVMFAGTGFAAAAVLVIGASWYLRRKAALRIQALTESLEKVNTGGAGLLVETGEDEFSGLQDEIYKTVTNLYQTRDAALEARNHFAENLSNIAHQLKTPITAISLSTQMMETHPSPEYPVQIRKQLKRLTYLEEALLLLSRIDAGTLMLEQASVDVFTILTLAAENLQELFLQAGVSADIPDFGEVRIAADLDWTMEAVMNLLKNCMEHAPAGTAVHCVYEKNPLYVQIRIWDEGEGFAREDLPHLFERFYRGKQAGDGGIGIGLSLAKEIFEMQGGMVSAMNLPAGGACFEIRMYRH